MSFVRTIFCLLNNKKNTFNRRFRCKRFKQNIRIDIKQYLPLYKTPNVNNLESLKAGLTNQYDYDKTLTLGGVNPLEEGLDINSFFTKK